MNLFTRKPVTIRAISYITLSLFLCQSTVIALPEGPNQYLAAQTWMGDPDAKAALLRLGGYTTYLLELAALAQEEVDLPQAELEVFNALVQTSDPALSDLVSSATSHPDGIEVTLATMAEPILFRRQGSGLGSRFGGLVGGEGIAADGVVGDGIQPEADLDPVQIIEAGMRAQMESVDLDKRVGFYLGNYSDTNHLYVLPSLFFVADHWSHNVYENLNGNAEQIRAHLDKTLLTKEEVKKYLEIAATTTVPPNEETRKVPLEGAYDKSLIIETAQRLFKAYPRQFRGKLNRSFVRLMREDPTWLKREIDKIDNAHITRMPLKRYGPLYNRLKGKAAIRFYRLILAHEAFQAQLLAHPKLGEFSQAFRHAENVLANNIYYKMFMNSWLQGEEAASYEELMDLYPIQAATEFWARLEVDFPALGKPDEAHRNLVIITRTMVREALLDSTSYGPEFIELLDRALEDSAQIAEAQLRVLSTQSWSKDLGLTRDYHPEGDGVLGDGIERDAELEPDETTLLEDMGDMLGTFIEDHPDLKKGRD